MKPPISYYGGKQRMVPKILPLIPKHTVYVEPFAGGAAVFFAKPWPNIENSDHYREVLNDKDERLINFYRVLQAPEKRETLIERLSLTLYSEAEYAKAKDLENGDEVQRAWAYFVNINTSFSNKLNGGWGRGTFAENNSATWVRRVARLPEYLERMSSVHIACDDALTVIRQWDSPQTFFYCDPPYPGTDCGHYGGYTVEDFQALVNTLNECQGSFILSNYEQTGATIPDDWERFEFQTNNHSRGRVGYDRSKKADESHQNRQRTEVVWRRFNRVPVRDEIKLLYASGAFDCFASAPTTETDDLPLFSYGSAL
jgi:DNA adenine methylase